MKVHHQRTRRGSLYSVLHSTQCSSITELLSISTLALTISSPPSTSPISSPPSTTLTSPISSPSSTTFPSSPSSTAPPSTPQTSSDTSPSPPKKSTLSIFSFVSNASEFIPM